MKKMIQAAPVFLNISILALLFFATAAPSIIDNSRAVSVAPTMQTVDGVAPTANNNIGYEPAGQVAPESMEDFGEEFAPTANNNIGYEPAGQVAPLKMEDFGDEVSPTANNNNIGYEPAGQVAPLKMEDFGDE